MIPSPQLFDRDAESIGDGDQGVATTRGVSLRTRACGDGYGNDELVSSVDVVGRRETVRGDYVAGTGMQRRDDAVE